MALLEVSGLEVEFPLRAARLQALRGVDFTLEAGERLGIVGESGAGKSMAAYAILNLISEPGRISDGEIRFDGERLDTLPDQDMRHIRGNRIAMIFQDPMMTLNPVLTIGTQMMECIAAHHHMPDAEAKALCIGKLKEVAIPSPEARFNAYPHELSGGLRQRVVIAIALLLDPAIIIADEPTTALDVTIQAEIMGLMMELCDNHKVGLILITHDLAVVSDVTQRMLVMYAGRVVETGTTSQVISKPAHPYTRGLLQALPQKNTAGGMLNQIPGTMPSLAAVPPGCAFHPRCQHSDARCSTELPELRAFGRRRVACHHAEALK
jgi:peptide/nickel transport system ATP-binding protein